MGVRERGVILALWALVIVVFFGLSAMALDAGVLYLARYHMTEAASAGLMAAMRYRALHGWTALQDPSKLSELYAAARRAALVNFRINRGVSLSAQSFEETNGFVDFDFDYDIEQDIVRVAASYDAPTFLIAAISRIGLPMQCVNVSGDPSRCRLVAAGPPSMQLDPAVVELVVDASGSMKEVDCPASGMGPCSASRMSRLQQAISNFALRFNPHRDYLGLIWFQTAAKELVPLQLLQVNAQWFRLAGSNGLVTTLNPGGNTNVTDGLLLAHQAIQAFQQVFDPDRRRPFSVVLFTDGAPNASRVSFSSDQLIDRPGLDLGAIRDGTVIGEYNRCLRDPSGDPVKLADQRNHWFLYRNDEFSQCTDGLDNDGNSNIDFPADLGCSSEDDNDEGTSLAPPPPPRAMPSLVHVTSRDELLYEDVNHLKSFSFRNKRVDPGSCNDFPDNPDPWQYAETPQISKNKAVCTGLFNTGFNWILRNFNFTLPALEQYGATDLTWGPYPVNFAGSTSVPGQFIPAVVPSAATDSEKKALQYRHSFSDQIAYYSAIEAADAVRAIEPGGRVYAVGLGTPISRTCNNPLQMSGEWVRQKPFFLERVALSIEDMFPRLPPPSSSRQSTIDTRHQFEGRRTITVDCPGTLEHGDDVVVGYTPITPKPWQVGSTFDPESLRERAGTAWAVENAEMLDSTFANVAMQILLRLMR